MNKNFSERIKSLKNAVFGVKEIVEDSILSNFKNPNPQKLVDAESAEAIKEINTLKESIPEVDKTEGIESMKNFSVDYKSLAEKVSDFIESQNWGPGYTPEDINELSNLLWEIVDFRPSPSRSTPPELDINKVKNIAEKYKIDLEDIKLNFAEEGESKSDDKVYSVFKDYLMKAKKPETFKKYSAAAQDPGFCNRFIEDKEFLSKFESGEGIKDESQKAEIIKLRKEFKKLVEDTRKGYSDTVNKSKENSEKAYVATSESKDDLGKLEISIKRCMLSNEKDNINKALQIIAQNPALMVRISKDDKFWEEFNKLNQSVNFAEESAESNKDNDSDKSNKGGEDKNKPKTWFTSDDIKDVKNSELRNKLDELFKKFEEELKKDNKKLADVIKKNEEGLKKVEGELADFIKNEDIKDGKNKGGWFLSPDDAKKKLQDAVKDSEGMTTTKSLGSNIRAAVANKLKSKKKSGDKLTKDESDILGDKMIEQSIKERERSNKLGLAKGLISGMDQPGADFLNSIFDFLAKKGQNDDAKKLIGESGKESAKKVNEGASFDLDDDEEDIRLNEIEEKDATKIINELNDVKDDASTENITSALTKMGFNEDQAKELLSPELVSDEEVESGDLKSVPDKAAISKLAVELGAPESIKESIPEKPVRGKDEDKEHFKARLALYKSEMATWKSLATVDNKMTMLKVIQALDKQKLENVKTGKLARSLAFLGLAGKFLKDGAEGVIDIVHKAGKAATDVASDVGKIASDITKDIGIGLSNSSEFVEAMGKASKDTLEGASKLGKDVLTGAGDAGKSLSEGLGDGLEHIEAGIGAAISSGRKTPEEIAAWAEAYATKNGAKVDAKKLEEAIRHNKELNKIAESVEKAKANSEKKNIKRSDKLDAKDSDEVSTPVESADSESGESESEMVAFGNLVNFSECNKLKNYDIILNSIF